MISQISQLISGISFVSVVTKDQKKFHDTIEFYEKLGFKRLQDYDHTSVISAFGVKTISTHCADSTKEAWLSALPPCESADSLNFLGATIKVRLSNSGPSLKEIQEKLEKINEVGQSKDWRGIESTFVFHTADMKSLLAILEPFKIQTAPADTAAVEAYVVDPLGNVIGFTSRLNPYTTNDKPVMLNEKSALEGFLSPAPSRRLESPVTGQGQKKRIAIMTSGGDAPGMNASVRAVVRTAIARGCDAYAIYEGYEGLVQGGNLIKPMYWEDVRGFLSIGGTLIGTARCAAFRERAGRLKATHNMIKNGIDALIVCGGDGSLTGADKFREEWPGLVKELVDKKMISKEQAQGHEHLYICGLVGSIDNDMCLTDATIGAYSSLDRICSAIDCIDATAQSHSRAFVIEVMGRHCGWLALMAGLASNADYIFIPERPPKSGAWSKTMGEVVKRHRAKGMRRTIVIVAEGAIDDELKPITAVMVKDALVELGLDTRITTLGHVQRGGTAVAADRLLATLQGIDAVDAVLSLTPHTLSPMIALTENKIVRRSLVDAVKLTSSVADAIKNKDFKKAMSMRDSEFIEHFNNFIAITAADNETPSRPADKKLKIAIINVGAPAGGMNAAIRAAACYCFSRGHKPYAIHNGFSGLARHESVREMDWLDVEEWATRGGCEIGTNRALPDTDIGMVAYYFQKHEFDGLIIIGGFEAYVSLHQLEEARVNYPTFRMPMVCLPATISNNVPGTEYSLGTDTCLNSLVEYCDVIKQSASSTRRRVFVVEVQGGQSGYVAAYAGLVTGAYAVYTPEEGISLKQLGSDIDYLKKCFISDNGRNRAGRLVLRNEMASQTFSTNVLVDILRNESDKRFEARAAIPGHVQQGGTPSPVDRARAIRLAIKCVQFLEEKQFLKEKPLMEQHEMMSVIGVRSSKLVFTPIRTLWEYETEVESRRPNKIHWEGLLTAADMLVGRPKV